MCSPTLINVWNLSPPHIHPRHHQVFNSNTKAELDTMNSLHVCPGKGREGNEEGTRPPELLGFHLLHSLRSRLAPGQGNRLLQPPPSAAPVGMEPSKMSPWPCWEAGSFIKATGKHSQCLAHLLQALCLPKVSSRPLSCISITCTAPVPTLDAADTFQVQREVLPVQASLCRAFQLAI